MGGTREIARALAAVTDHLRPHPEAGRVADPDRDRGRHRGAALPGHRPAGQHGRHRPAARAGRRGRRALVAWAERHSPVAAAARRPLPVTVELAID